MAIYRPPKPQQKPQPTGTGYPASTLKTNPNANPPTAGDAGYSYTPSSPNAVSQGQTAANLHNSYQQQPLATPTTPGGQYGSGLLSSIDARRKNARAALETGYRQTAADKAWGYDNSAIARKSAGDAYETGRADTQNAWDTTRIDTTSAKDTELGALEKELSNLRSTYAADDARAIQQRNEQNNKTARMFGNLGTHRGLNFASTRTNADTNWDLGRLGVKERNRNAEQENLRQAANRGSYWDSTLARQGEKSATDLRDLGNTYQSSLLKTNADQAYADRNSMLTNERLALGYQDALTSASSDEARTMYDLARGEAQDKLARDTLAANNNPADRAADIAYKEAQTRLVEAQTRKQNAVDPRDRLKAQADIDETNARIALIKAQADAEARGSEKKSAYSGTDVVTARKNFADKLATLIQPKAKTGTGIVGRAISGLKDRFTKPPDVQAIEDEIYAAFPGDTADAVKMRQQLVRDANNALKANGYTGVAISGAMKPVQTPAEKAQTDPEIIKIYDRYKADWKPGDEPLMSLTDFMKSYGKYNQPSIY